MITRRPRLEPAASWAMACAPPRTRGVPAGRDSPGTHLTHAEYFRAHGPEAFLAAAGYPPIRLPEPEQVTGEAGDLLLAHYLLGHNIGGNTSRAVRRAVYFRIKRAGHDPRWREFLQDPWLDYDAVRERPG